MSCIFTHLLADYFQVVKDKTCHIYDLLERPKPYERPYPHDPLVTVQCSVYHKLPELLLIVCV